MSYFQVSLQKFSGLSHPVTNSANFNASLTTLDLKDVYSEFDLTFAVTDKKNKSSKRKRYTK